MLRVGHMRQPAGLARQYSHFVFHIKSHPTPRVRQTEKSKLTPEVDPGFPSSQRNEYLGNLPAKSAAQTHEHGFRSVLIDSWYKSLPKAPHCVVCVRVCLRVLDVMEGTVFTLA